MFVDLDQFFPQNGERQGTLENVQVVGIGVKDDVALFLRINVVSAAFVAAVFPRQPLAPPLAHARTEAPRVFHVLSHDQKVLFSLKDVQQIIQFRRLIWRQK